MRLALAEAQHAFEQDEVPVGAIIVARNQVIARAHNLCERLNDFTAHAEMQAFTAASEYLGGKHLDQCTLYVTLEPCPMCATAISFARIRRVYYGASDPKGGGVEHGPCIFTQPTCHHKPEVYGGLEEARCAALLRDFFAQKREQT